MNTTLPSLITGGAPIELLAEGEDVDSEQAEKLNNARMAMTLELRTLIMPRTRPHCPKRKRLSSSPMGRSALNSAAAQADGQHHR